MSLRPVSAVFYEPKHKFIVIYQNGSLWQLPRMKIDIISWRNRKSYLGSKEKLYLLKEQKIDDPNLAKIIHTQHLPTSLWNINLLKFESWWKVNSHAWLTTERDELNVVKSHKNAVNSVQQTENKAIDEKASNDIITPTKNKLTSNQVLIKTVEAANQSNQITDKTKVHNTINQNKQSSKTIITANTHAENNTVVKDKNRPKRELSFLAKQYLDKQRALEKKKEDLTDIEKNPYSNPEDKKRDDKNTNLSEKINPQDSRTNSSHKKNIRNSVVNPENKLANQLQPLKINQIKSEKPAQNNTKLSPIQIDNNQKTAKSINENVFDGLLSELNLV